MILHSPKLYLAKVITIVAVNYGRKGIQGSTLEGETLGGIPMAKFYNEK
jgi:hypothetical protein